MPADPRELPAVRRRDGRGGADPAARRLRRSRPRSPRWCRCGGGPPPFDGEARTDAGHTSLAGIADRVERLFGADIRPWVVVWGRQLPAGPAGRRVLLDPDGATHRRYGATAEALYLVCPDGYVGLRAQPASAEVLVRYLGRVLDRAGADVPQQASPEGPAAAVRSRAPR